jgi:hypothetical protein
MDYVEAAVGKNHFLAGALKPANFVGDSVEGRKHMILPS